MFMHVDWPVCQGAFKTVSARRLEAWLHSGEELALFDVREAGQFGEGHLFNATPLPYSRLELDLVRLVPRNTTPIVICDGGDDDLAQRAALAMARLGYELVWAVEGGLPACVAHGMRLFKGVNLPSKAFGELVEQRLHTPSIAAEELLRRQQSGDKLLVLDGRPLHEFRKMSIPGAICCPNGELALRISELAPEPDTTIVINCAGRTRSIIGAQTLINLGLPNPVLALEDGTQGWHLADLPLEHGQSRHYPAAPGAVGLALAAQRAGDLAQRYRVPVLDGQQLASILSDDNRTHYLLDVRTHEEFACGSLPGAQHAPGGQLLQATDQYVAVRNAVLLVFDDEGVRAPVIASWLRQMGHDARVVGDGLRARVLPSTTFKPHLPELEMIAADELARACDKGKALVLDLRNSQRFREAHVPGAVWTIRPQVVARVRALADKQGRRLVLVADDTAIAGLVADELIGAGLPAPLLLEGSLAGWIAAGHPVQASRDIPPDCDCIDYLFFVHDRHDGNKAAARQYLEWEKGLLAQLRPQELAVFAPA